MRYTKADNNALGSTMLAATFVLSFLMGGQAFAQEPDVTDPGQAGSSVEADFTLYVSIDELKRELDRGADFVLIDARARPDYLFDHITGAISMPFYEVEERFTELPKDKWVIAYCACPRAEAENAVGVLKKNGFHKVAVMYDGYFEWRDLSYPITSGDGD